MIGNVQSKGFVENLNRETVSVPAELLAADALPELVAQTQADYRERGLVIGMQAGKIVRSQVFIGTAESYDTEYSEATTACCRIPMLPFGLRSLVRTVKEISVIHTHPLPPELDHLRTSPVSDKDIGAFVSTAYPTMVIADRGGIHLIAKNKNLDVAGAAVGSNIVSNAIRETVGEGGGSLQVMQKVARRLHPYGISYLYTPGLKHPSENIDFRNQRFAAD